MSQYRRIHNNRTSRRPTMLSAAAAVAAFVYCMAVGASAASTGKADSAVVESVVKPQTIAAPQPLVATATATHEPAVAESKKMVGGLGLMDGYLKTQSNKGDRGYDESDAFGNGDSDSYGYGSQVEYGSGKAGDGGTSGAYHESTAYDDNGKSNPKYKAWHFEEKDGKPTKRYIYDSRKPQTFSRKKEPQVEATEYDSVEAYDDGDDGTHAGYEAEDPEYGNLYDSADVDVDTYY